jgi:succinate dehydrogenase/fumarate reductase flavoprotein subunit
MHAIGPPYMLELYQHKGKLGTAPPEEFRFKMGALYRNIAGVLHNERGESSLKGLFIAGDVGGGIPGYGASAAFVWALRCAKYASEEAIKAEAPTFDKLEEGQVRAARNHYLAPLARKKGANPVELENMVRTLNDYYVGPHKAGPKLKRHLELLDVIKKRYVPVLTARNPHELMRCIEVQSAITVSQLHTNASLVRTESRLASHHYRVDYPNQDDVNWKKSIVWQNVGGKMEHSFKVND